MKNVDRGLAAEIILAVGAVLAVTVAIIALSIIVIPIHAFILKLAWNYVVPKLFGLPKIGFWQALALVIVSRILIKSSHTSTHNSSK